MVTKNPEIVVRQATLDDSTILSQFNMSMAEETEGRQLDQTTVNAGVKQLFRDSRQGFYLMAEVGGSARGTAGFLRGAQTLGLHGGDVKYYLPKFAFRKSRSRR